LPTQIYQALLFVTHDPIMLVILRGLLCASITAGALVWLARTLALPIWFAAAILISPHVLTYHRVLWDATFTIPLGTLAFAAFADFLRSERRLSLRICLAATVMLPLIHPQALPLALPILGWLLWHHRTALWNDRWVLLAIAAVLLVFQGRYIYQAFWQVIGRFSAEAPRSYPGAGSAVASALASLLGGRILSGAEYRGVENFSEEAPVTPFVAAAAWCARAIYPLIWIGIGLALVSLAEAVGRLLRGARLQDFTVQTRLMMVVAAGLCGQALLSGAMRVPALPQYFMGTFVLHVLLAWFAVATLQRWRLGTVLGVLFGAGAAVLTGYALQNPHPRMPTLANSVAIARELNDYSDSTVMTDVAVYRDHPQILRTLRLLIPAPPGIPQRESGRLFITSAPANDARSGAVRLIEAIPPAEAGELLVTPLPRNWVPDESTW
jgi:hypothetical protein